MVALAIQSGVFLYSLAVVVTQQVGTTQDSCTYTDVLEDHADGWPCNCEGLVEDTGAPGDIMSDEKCKANCNADLNCEVWQFAEGKCLRGQGHDCRGQATKVITACQRIQHGAVNPLAFSKNWKCTGLGPLNMGQTTDTQETLVNRCKFNCYSKKSCNVWVYDATGCHFGHDDGTNCVDTVESQNVIYQERFERSCPSDQEAAAKSFGKDLGEHPMLYLGIAGAVVLLLVGALLFYFFGGGSESSGKKSSKTRDVNLGSSNGTLKSGYAQPLSSMGSFAGAPVSNFVQAAPMYQQVPMMSQPMSAAPITNYSRPMISGPTMGGFVGGAMPSALQPSGSSMPLSRPME